MTNETASRLTLLERAGGSPSRDVPAAEGAVRRYLSAVGLDPDARELSWGESMTDALTRAAALVGPSPTLETFRDARIREAHTAAYRATWPDGDPSRLAAVSWREGLDAARAVARNLAWDAATSTWSASLGDARFAKGTVESLLGSRLASYAVDAQFAAVGFAVWPELASGRPSDWIALEEPRAEAFLAGVYRFWVLPGHVVLVPRMPVA